MARVAMCMAVLVLLAATAVAQTVSGQNSAAFAGLGIGDLTYRYNLPTDAYPRSVLMQSNSTALVATRANIVSRVFSIAPCESFLPHIHPNGSEFFVGRDGRLQFNVMLNGEIVRTDITPGDTLLVPQGSIHYFYNQECTQANVLASLNSAAPGFQGFYDPPDVITGIRFQTSDFNELLQRTPNTTLDQTRAFPKLTTDCKARCNAQSPGTLPTAPPSSQPSKKPSKKPTKKPTRPASNSLKVISG